MAESSDPRWSLAGVPVEDVADLVAAVTRAQTRIEAARIVLTWAADLSEVEVSVGLYLRMGAETGSGLRAARLDGDWPAAEPAVRRAYHRGVPTPLDAGLFPLSGLQESPPDGGVAVPLGDQGVLVASGARPEAVPLLDLVAALTRLALDRAEGVETSRRGWAAYRSSRTAHRRLRAVWAAVRDAEARAMQSRSAETVRRATCEELASSGPFRFAWFAALDEHSDALVPAERVGAGRHYLDRVPLDASASTPAVRAVVDRAPVLESDLLAGNRSDPWRRAARASGFGSVLAVPIAADGPVHGVLEVATGETARIGATERRSLDHLGNVLAYVFDAIVLRQTFLGESTVELQLRVRDADSPLAALSREFETELTFESASSEPDGSTRIAFEGDLATDAVQDAADVLPAGSQIHPLQGRGSFGLYEVTDVGETLPGLLASLGVAVTSLEVDGSELYVTVAVAGRADVRRLVESIREVYPETELLARRTTTRPLRGGSDIHSLVQERLTDRQFEVLQAAYYGGYFDWPRGQSSVDLADSLGVAQPTFSRHLRAAERKLTGLVFED
jgi:predicted DNA binding protein